MRTVVRLIAEDEAAAYLRELGFGLGNWNEVAPANTGAPKPKWLNVQAPRDANQMRRLSQHAAGWLPRGKWKIVQFDNSNCFSRVENSFVSSLVVGPGAFVDFSSVERPAILFEFGDEADQNENLELLISNLVYVVLMFEGHAYVISSGSAAGEYLGVQDGFLYFHSLTKDVSGAQRLIEEFRSDPTQVPTWIVDIIKRGV